MIAPMVDDRYNVEQSILLRNHKHPALTLSIEALSQASIRESVNLAHLLDYKGVPIFMLDETTGMASHTFESLVAAVSIAHCLQLGYQKVCFSSGGNLGEALTLYGRRVGIKTFSFNPAVNIPFLDGELFSAKDGHWLIGVSDAQRNRELALDFSRRAQQILGYDPIIPHSTWRTEALAARGLFLLDYMLANDMTFEAITQTISAGFGPLAIFDVLFEAERHHELDRVPRFIGVQQEANCYMYQRWKGTHTSFDNELIVPTLFDHNPDRSFGTYPALDSMLKRSHGDLVTINKQEFTHYITPAIMDRISTQGVQHTIKGGQYEATGGLMALAGTLKAIDQGIITQGPILHCMCDGVRPVTSAAQASAIINGPDDLDPLIRDFIKL